MNGTPRIAKGVMLLAGYTARSQTYAQGLIASGFAPETCVLFGDPQDDVPRKDMCQPSDPAPNDLFIPDLSVSLGSSVEKAGWNVDCIEVDDVNSPEIGEIIARVAPSVVIYSGYGGQLVGSDLLAGDAQFLHMHAGWLPDYRGSTTVYYSWLEEDRMGVTALLLNEGIDEGPILHRKHYPVPPAGINVDLVYDCAIRADLLVEIIRHYHGHSRLPDAAPQDPGGNTYYKIHPILKHIALLQNEAAD